MTCLLKVMVIYSVVMARPSFHFDWGLSFWEKELDDTGAHPEVTKPTTATSHKSRGFH